MPDSTKGFMTGPMKDFILDSFIFKDDLHIESSKDSTSEEVLTQQLSETEAEILAIKSRILDLKTELEEKEIQKAKISEELEKIGSSRVDIKLNEPKILPTSSALERITFVFNLFHGRRDVYAERASRLLGFMQCFLEICAGFLQLIWMRKLGKKML
jgi:hypothetical protein